MSDSLPHTSRRQVLSGLTLALAPVRALGAGTDASLRFAVFRNGAHVGEHEMTFVRAADAVTATSAVAMVIRLGPVPVFRYRHQARETWRGDRFEHLETSTTSNGKLERVSARALSGGVSIETGAGASRAPATAAPLTHWNPRAFTAPLFNPQTGKLLKVSVSRTANEHLKADGGGAHWSVRGEAEIDDWYDGDGAWSALRGRLPDRSILEYRRL